MTLWGHVASLTAKVKELEGRQEQLRKMYEFYTRDADLHEYKAKGKAPPVSAEEAVWYKLQ